MTKKSIIRPALILLLSTAFLAGCANQGHHGKSSGGHSNNGGHSNSGGGHSNSDGGHGNSEGGHGTTVIEDEAHPTH